MTDPVTVFLVAGLVAVGVLAVSFLVLRRVLVLCPPDQILVMVGRGAHPSIRRRGVHVLLPIVQVADLLPLGARRVEIPGVVASLRNGEQSLVSTVIWYGVSSEPGSGALATERLLGLEPRDRDSMVKSILPGAIRAVMAEYQSGESPALREDLSSVVRSRS